jgi:hypothetical protein
MERRLDFRFETEGLREVSVTIFRRLYYSSSEIFLSVDFRMPPPISNSFSFELSMSNEGTNFPVEVLPCQVPGYVGKFVRVILCENFPGFEVVLHMPERSVKRTRAHFLFVQNVNFFQDLSQKQIHFLPPIIGSRL